MFDDLNTELEILRFDAETARKQGLTLNPKRVEEFYSKITTKLTGLLPSDKDTHLNLFVVKDWVKVTKDLPYLTVAENEIYQPRGLKTDLLTYARYLHDEMVHTLTIDERVISPFNLWISGVIEDPAKLKELAKLNIEYSDVAKRRKELAKYVDVTSEQTTGDYGDIIRRNKDWGEIVTLVNEITELSTKTNLDRIKKKIESMKAHTENLVNVIEASSDVIEFSKASINNLSEETLSIALEIEFHGLMLHQALALNACLANNLDEIIKLK